jgi:hypothetical protein
MKSLDGKPQKPSPQQAPEEGKQGAKSQPPRSMRDHFLNEILTIEDLPCDIRNALHVCSTGKYYEWFAEAVFGWTDITQVQRAFVKDQWLHLAFGKDGCNKELVAKFGEVCPNVAAYLKSLKKGNGGYKNAARTLQQIEAEIMIGGVVGRLMVEHPDVPVLTVHDSVITTETNVELVKQILVEEWQKYGITPTLSTK